MGRILDVNLNEGSIKVDKTDEKIAEKYLGGKGYATAVIYRILMEYIKDGISPADIDAFGEENVIIFATGPATGIAKFPSSGRYHVMAMKSPLTGSIASANSGGKWGPYLKFAGFDAVIIRGASPEPVYLEVYDGEAELRSASNLWGKTTFDTTKILIEKHGKCSVACIGPAGENGVLFSAVINDNHRAAGRTGIGAIMGSKGLKAIVVGGNERPVPAEPETYNELVNKAIDKIKSHPVTGEGLPKYGTAVLVNIINNAGIFPTKNWQTGIHPKADSISGESLAENYLIKNGACWGCQIGCARVTKVDSGPYNIEYSEGPEYESIWSLGGTTGIEELDAVIKANHLCDELGIDTISMGSTIACAMELVEKGCIPDELLEGIDLRFGNAPAVVEMIWRTAYRSGFGKYLALGSKRLAEIFGCPELSMSVKGLEMPAYDPRGAKGIGLNYATANRGGCHVTGYTISPEILGCPEKIDPLSYEGKAMWVKVFQDFTCVVNSAVNCLFTTFALGADDYAYLLSAVTGRKFSSDDIMKIGERIYNLERLIINMYGFSGEDDSLPKRLLEEPMPEGPAKGETVDIERLKNEYYKLRGWENGKPTKEKLRELGIETLLVH